jgi:hypothetical protein
MYLIDNQHHNLPHIHAKYAEFEASIGIADGDICPSGGSSLAITRAPRMEYCR